MKFLNFFLLFGSFLHSGIRIPNTDPDTLTWFNPDPDPKPCMFPTLMLIFGRILGAGAAPPGVPIHPGVDEEAGKGGEGGAGKAAGGAEATGGRPFRCRHCLVCDASYSSIPHCKMFMKSSLFLYHFYWWTARKFAFYLCYLLTLF